MKKVDWKTLGVIVLTLELAGAVSALASGSIPGKYMALVKPPLSPPPWIFGVVWPVLYAAMGVALYLVIKSDKQGDKNNAYALFGLQIFFNLLWPTVYFRFGMLWLALVNLLVLDVLVYLTQRSFRPFSRWAYLLFWPYLAWVLFATYLNLGTAILN